MPASKPRARAAVERDVAVALERFRERCRTEGVPFTLQRRVILEAVLRSDTHPTPDEVHETVARRHPNVSRSTVYRTLEQLARMGLITKACRPGRPLRYDRRTDLHHHLVCLRCDTMIDFEDPALDAVRVPDTSQLGFQVSEFRVQLRGLCQRCRREEERE